MGLFSSLGAIFGGGEAKNTPVEPVEYKGYLIYFEPRDQGGQFGVGARITKGEGEQMKEHRFDRADTMPTREVCEEITLMKARTTIDQLGDRIFD